MTTMSPFGDLEQGSRNYWAGHISSENPPPPSYRRINGKLVLGRYMDPWGCQAHMRGAKGRWGKWYTDFFVISGSTVAFGSGSILFLPLAFVLYFFRRGQVRQQYDLYYGVMNRIMRTGEPEWVPYDKDRLALIDRNPLAYWP